MAAIVNGLEDLKRALQPGAIVTITANHAHPGDTRIGWPGIVVFADGTKATLRHTLPDGNHIHSEVPWPEAEKIRFTQDGISIAGTTYRIDRVAELRVNGGLARACYACGAGNVIGVSASDWRCHACGAETSYRWCPRCAHLKIITLGAEDMPWGCVNCRYSFINEMPTTHWPPAAAFEVDPARDWERSLYTERIEEAMSDPERRRIGGKILSVTGISGIAAGNCHLIFDRTAVLIAIRGNVQRRLNYSDVTALQFGGRGAFTTTSGGGWTGGGFGAKGFIEGVGLSMVLNALTTHTEHHIETIVYLNWTSGNLALLNTFNGPQGWARSFASVVQRIEAHQPNTHALTARSNPAADDKVCPFCAETIKAAAIKCRYCGSELPPA